VADRELAERAAQPLLRGDQEIGGVTQLERGRGVPDVVRGQADVDESRVLADLLLEAREERDHLVLDALLDREDPAMSTRAFCPMRAIASAGCGLAARRPRTPRAPP
jgi:hypothetical protein